MRVLKELLYSKDHEWVKVEDGKAYIGITDFAQKSLGNIVYVELPEAETELSKGDAFGVIESVKAASDAYIPVDGKIIEANEEVVDDPSLINQDCYENWMIYIEIKDESQLSELMSSEEYEKHCSKEA
ncbi:glycine cleavage system H protein [Caloramator quimbayensis]|uniref:Glycine cleavage system H protein n=1 Tax=Caloramator quimbayensis TaxID=1147123 RepID=A0A1T4XGB4_9CLOT|nr:glycine cleavage system protein GcvH [Caloramator quimbayensis]SKA88115.1 glycine cleavage system H protein [Caloramator quimbayensis]